MLEDERRHLGSCPHVDLGCDPGTGRFTLIAGGKANAGTPT
jgi:hypothetical protein